VATKSRTRAKGGAAPGAPRPKVEPRKAPLGQRPWFRWTAAAVAAVVAIFIGLTVWGHLSRSSALRSYRTKLFDAARPFFQDIEQSDTSMQQTVGNFRDGKIDSTALTTASAKWEADFRSARDAVQNLKPPSELINAQADFLAALDEYIGVARFYTVVEQQRALEKAVPTKNQKAVEDQVILMLQHIGDARARADALYTKAVTAIDALAKHWGVKTKTPFPTAPGTVPPAGASGQPGSPLTIPS
jgi:hypothetical protein